MSTQQNTMKKGGSVAAFVTHDVMDFEVWKHAFDEHAPARRAAGIIATHVQLHASVPNRVSLYVEGTDTARLHAFLHSTALMMVMWNAGVKGPPHVVSMAPVEDFCVKDDRLAGLILQHEVADYGTWKPVFDAHAGARAKAGVVGHALYRLLHSPNTMLIHLQAETVGALEAFAATSDLEQTMSRSGVLGSPDLTFTHGGEWAS